MACWPRRRLSATAASLYVAAATSAGKIEASASGVYTVGNIVANHIEIVKIGGGAPVIGWSEFAGNPCPASTPGEHVVSPYVDVMVADADGVEAIVVTLRYTDTTPPASTDPTGATTGRGSRSPPH